MTEFIRVYDTRTNEKLPHLVPENFLKLFPYLSKTPLGKAAEKQVTEPAKSASTNVKEPKNG